MKLGGRRGDNAWRICVRASVCVTELDNLIVLKAEPAYLCRAVRLNRQRALIAKYSQALLETPIIPGSAITHRLDWLAALLGRPTAAP